MAEKQIKIGRGGKFGARYGRRLRVKVALIEAEKRASTKCPYCNYEQVKRLASGIWFCKKCSSKFSGMAYTFRSKINFEKEAEKPEALSRKRIKAAADKSKEVAEVYDDLMHTLSNTGQITVKESELEESVSEDEQEEVAGKNGDL